MSRWIGLLIACMAVAPAWAEEAASETAPAVPAAESPDPAPGAAVAAGRMVSLSTAYHTRFDAYLAGAEDAPVGVLLVPDRWGLGAEVKDWADRVAALGYRVLAVDLYDGRHVADAGAAAEVWRSIDPVWIEADLDAAMAYLSQGQGRIVLMGWGKGVGAAVPLLERHPGVIRAMVTYYDSETLMAGDRAGKQPFPVLDVLTPRTLAGPPAETLPAQATADAWTATEQFLTRLFQ